MPSESPIDFICSSLGIHGPGFDAFDDDASEAPLVEADEDDDGLLASALAILRLLIIWTVASM